jgi:SAM-dependent methyltransferase
MVSVHSSSTGQALSGTEWLDAHFGACRPEYEALFRRMPFEAGDVILDGGCGSGGFLPLLHDATGPSGAVLALDMAIEHLSHLPASADGLAADLTRLPLRDESVDGVWSANVSQYFDDDGLRILLDELTRVLRPGGLLALKDVDMKAWAVEPAPPFLGAHLAEACAASGGVQSAGSIRGRRLRRILEAAGFGGVQQHSLLIERWAPMDKMNGYFWAGWLVYLAAVASEAELPDEDDRFWRSVATPEQAAAFVARPDFYGSELQTVAFGRKPRSAA